jgi:hypothetical protein
MQLVLKEGWLTKTMTNSVCGERWEFSEYKPDYTEDCFDAKANEHVPGEVKRIIYAVADEAEVSP